MSIYIQMLWYILLLKETSGGHINKMFAWTKSILIYLSHSTEEQEQCKSIVCHIGNGRGDHKFGGKGEGGKEYKDTERDRKNRETERKKAGSSYSHQKECELPWPFLPAVKIVQMSILLIPTTAWEKLNIHSCRMACLIKTMKAGWWGEKTART